MFILGAMCIFSPVYANTGNRDKTIVLVYDSKNPTGKDVVLPGIGVSPQAAFAILGKAGRISLKHAYKVYADLQYYYFVDAFLGTPEKDEGVRRKSVKIRRDEKLTASDIEASS